MSKCPICGIRSLHMTDHECQEPPSDTQETDEAQFGTGRVSVDFARRLERERNEAVAVLVAIEERYADGDDTYEDWKFMGETARAFLSGNDKSR